jgi:hypothetical protein
MVDYDLQVYDPKTGRTVDPGDVTITVIDPDNNTTSPTVTKSQATIPGDLPPGPVFSFKVAGNTPGVWNVRMVPDMPYLGPAEDTFNINPSVFA